MVDKQSVLTRAEQVLETLRPYLKYDGGDIEIDELTDDMTLKLRLLGNCKTCSIQQTTLVGIAKQIKSLVPEIKTFVKKRD